ncbi:patatin-like phospholipase family protein [Herpetosiphon giganteus]|uniref:patatin-like phospholipase family protein n=1 Tax=Herpetosiphon giganteus TaxID=2029754 RepID=UPI001956E8BB|nr:patatin-like phospholipase family protein [Herpetosiphon giganteus]MBM7846497.1 putative acylesterase/phospholipase RssA [Herpetosiphon giganteus]
MDSILPPACIAFQGGGALGMAHLGAWQVLEKHFRFVAVAGTSAGSIVGTLCAAGYGSLHAIDIFSNLNWPEFVRSQKWLDLFRARDGWSDGDKFYHWLKERIALRFMNRYPDINFKQLYEETGIYLAITACNLNNSNAEPVIFDVHREPETSVAFAVRASISIPGLFVAVPRRDRGQVLVDGGIVLNLPIELIEDISAEHQYPIIGVRFDKGITYLDKPNVKEVLSRSLSAATMHGNISPSHITSNPKYIDVAIDVKEFDSLNFNLKENEKHDLIQRGRNAAEIAILHYQSRINIPNIDKINQSNPINTIVSQKNPSTIDRKPLEIASLRKYIIDSLSEQDLRELISDHFPDIKADLGYKYSFRDAVSTLIDYSYRQEQIKRLVKLVGHINPNQYNKLILNYYIDN